jgi:hypothetical protein
MELNLIKDFGGIVLVITTSFGRSIGRFASRKIRVSLETKQGGKDGIGLYLWAVVEPALRSSREHFWKNGP